MLIFVSDLHLATVDFKATMSLSRFFGALSGILGRRRDEGVEEATLVLLGDIFEILKAPQWLEPPVLRPWQKEVPEHGPRVEAIFSKIVEANR